MLSSARKALQRAALFALVWFAAIAIAVAPAQAKLTDDSYDGNIYALYGGNGSLVPPRVNLTQSLQLGRPAMLVFYVDDSADCKRFTPVLNQAQAFYGKYLSIIPIAVDSLPSVMASPSAFPEAAYYRGYVPQTVVIDTNGQVIYDREGVTSFEAVNAALQTLGLPAPDPRLVGRNEHVGQINEINP